MNPENVNVGGDHRNNERMEHEDTGYAAARIRALGSMDIALLTANVNQLRLLRAYNSKASTYYISLFLVILSLVIQVAVGIALILRRRWRLYNRNPTRFVRTNEFVVCAVFAVTVINVLLMAFIETDGMDKSDKENEKL